MDGSGVYAVFCSYCGQSNQLNSKCNTCQVALYCNTEHQCMHWEVHKHQCQFLKIKLPAGQDGFVPHVNSPIAPMMVQSNIPNLQMGVHHNTPNVQLDPQHNARNVQIGAQHNARNVQIGAQHNAHNVQIGLQHNTRNVQIGLQCNTPNVANSTQQNVNNIQTNTMYNAQNYVQPSNTQSNLSDLQPQLQTTTDVPRPKPTWQVQSRASAPKSTFNNSTYLSAQKTNENNKKAEETATVALLSNPPPVIIIMVKSFSTFPIFDAPEGISKDDLIKKHADCAVNMLNNEGYCVIDELLGKQKLNNIINETVSLFNSGIMKNGDIVQTKPGTKEDSVRDDKIVWVSGKEEICSNIDSLINVLDHLITFCGSRLKQNIEGRTQAMVACYLGDGGGYKHHIDNGSKDGRAITCIYYLNPGWSKEKDGGVLKLHANAKSSYLEIEPLADRLLMFWADHRTPHMVEAAYRKRFAITLWYFDADEREEMRQNYVANLQKQFAETA